MASSSMRAPSASRRTLTLDERNRLAKAAVETARGRVPVVAATGSQSHAETIALVAAAEKAGADAHVDRHAVLRQAAAARTGRVLHGPRRAERRLPMLIYHIPGRTAVWLDLDTLERIAEEVSHFVGIKHAVNDLAFVTQMLARFGAEFRVFVGLEELSFPMLAVGARGVMNAVANIAPRRVAELCELVQAGDLNGARKLHFELFELNLAVFFDTNPIPMKYMMKRVGLMPGNEHRLPMVPATPELERRLDEVLVRARLNFQDRASQKVRLSAAAPA